MKLKTISRGFAVIFVFIFTAMLGLTSLAFEAQADVNQMLGTSSYKIVDTGDGSEDTEYAQPVPLIPLWIRNSLLQKRSLLKVSFS